MHRETAVKSLRLSASPALARSSLQISVRKAALVCAADATCRAPLLRKSRGASAMVALVVLLACFLWCFFPSGTIHPPRMTNRREPARLP